MDLLDFEIDYGQGFLFGEPRAVREDAPETAAAPAAPEAAPAPPQGMTALFQQRGQRRAAG
ncbi:MAG: hypothetical protein QM698_06125 [Micropepsaceae bacterium]